MFVRYSMGLRSLVQYKRCRVDGTLSEFGRQNLETIASTLMGNTQIAAYDTIECISARHLN